MRHAAKFTQARTSASPGSPHTYTHAPASVRTCRPHDVHRHLLCSFPDARRRYQNVEPKCVWAVVSNSIWGKRQISCSPFPTCCLLTAIAVPSAQNTGRRDVLGHPCNALSPTNYFAHCPLLFKHSPRYLHHFFFQDYLICLSTSQLESCPYFQPPTKFWAFALPIALGVP